MARVALPHRRPLLTTATDWNGHPLKVSVGFDLNGDAKEVFCDTAHGGQMQHTVSDACVLISIALQHGVTPAELAKSLGRVPAWIGGEETTAPASPVGTILAVVAEGVV